LLIKELLLHKPVRLMITNAAFDIRTSSFIHHFSTGQSSIQ
jgi:hypothetical protein